jgi:hypothetical protein
MVEAAQGYTSADWIDPSKIGPPHWLHSEDAFQQMLARVGSGELAADDLHAWLRSRDWLSVELRVNADGTKTCRRLTADFYRDVAWLEALPDVDAVDHLEIHYPDRVDPSSEFDWHTSFWVRAAEFARELERLYPAILYPTTAAPPSTAAAPASHAPDQQQSRLAEASKAAGGTKLRREPSFIEAARDAAIRHRLINGVHPGRNVQWARFCHRVRADCGVYTDDPKKIPRGLSDDRITRITRVLMKRQA